MSEERLYDPKKRMEICKTCPFLIKGIACKKCGCIMAAKTKVKWANCPMGYWVVKDDTNT